jgi:hypothetical protein
VDVFLKGDSFVDYLDRLHDILHQEDGLQLRQNVVQPAVQSKKNFKFVKVCTFSSTATMHFCTLTIGNILYSKCKIQH